MFSLFSTFHTVATQENERTWKKTPLTLRSIQISTLSCPTREASPVQLLRQWWPEPTCKSCSWTFRSSKKENNRMQSTGKLSKEGRLLCNSTSMISMLYRYTMLYLLDPIRLKHGLSGLRWLKWRQRAQAVPAAEPAPVRWAVWTLQTPPRPRLRSLHCTRCRFRFQLQRYTVCTQVTHRYHCGITGTFWPPRALDFPRLFDLSRSPLWGVPMAQVSQGFPFRSWNIPRLFPFVTFVSCGFLQRVPVLVKIHFQTLGSACGSVFYVQLSIHNDRNFQTWLQKRVCF